MIWITRSLGPAFRLYWHSDNIITTTTTTTTTIEYSRKNLVWHRPSVYLLIRSQSIYAQLVMQTIGQRLTPNGRASRHIVLARHASNDAGVRNDSTVALNAASNI